MAAMLVSGFGSILTWLMGAPVPGKSLRRLLSRYRTEEAKLSLMGLGPHN